MKTWIETAQHINRLAFARTPFLFAFDFQGDEAFALPLREVDPQMILYRFGEHHNIKQTEKPPGVQRLLFSKKTLDPDLYKNAFDKVMFHLRRGDSYLLNLTFGVDIESNLSLREIFHQSQAPYKLWIKDRFVVFSPESFVHIHQNRIHTFPMKGTIHANHPHAEKVLMTNRKELAEHYTIVDLLRNDLSMVAQKVRVEKFRYVETIQTLNGALLQTSSHISGVLPNNWQVQLGDILLRLLPAGSVSGAPKKRTVEIIRQTEDDARGFYTGVMGLFDGSALHSAVMIRFVETHEGGLRFRAGGGITINSSWQEEYDELLQKVVLPIPISKCV